MSWFSSRKQDAPQRFAKLSIEQLEDRLTPSFTFSNGLLVIHANTQFSSDFVQIVAIGSANDGSTGVRVHSNLVRAGLLTNIGSASNPVTAITLDLKDGNDSVSIAPLAQVKIRIGEGNGFNHISVGGSLAIGVVAGTGLNNILVGGGSSNTLTGLAPGNTATSAGTVVLVGFRYS